MLGIVRSDSQGFESFRFCQFDGQYFEDSSACFSISNRMEMLIGTFEFEFIENRIGEQYEDYNISKEYIHNVAFIFTHFYRQSLQNLLPLGRQFVLPMARRA